MNKGIKASINIKYVLLLFNLLLTVNIFAQNIDIDSITQNGAYKPGEELIYSIKYGLLKGGEAKLEIKVIQSGIDFYYYVKAEAVTTGIATKFAKIYDVYESYIDIKNGYPIKSVRNIKEGRYTYYNEVLFYRDQNFVISLNKPGKIYIPSNTLDLLSAFYYARRHIFKHQLKKDEEINLITFFDNELYPVTIKFKKKEVIKSKFGRVKCLKFVPVLKKDNPFKSEDDLQIWFSDDGNYIPIRIKMKAKVGTIKAELVKFSNLKNNFGG